MGNKRKNYQSNPSDVFKIVRTIERKKNPKNNVGTLPPVLDLTISHKVIAAVTVLFLRQLPRVKRNMIFELLR